MTTRTGLGRDRTERVLSVVLLTVLAGCAGLAPTAKAAKRDEVLLVVQDAPADGVILASVDLTAAVRWCQVGPIDPARMQAVTPEGRTVSLQFVPAPDYDPKDRVAGTVVFRLPKTVGGPLRLVFGRREQVRGPNDGNDKQATVTTPAWDGMVVTPEFAIQHDAERMGGLPAKIVFRKTGKVFSEFAWNDRVFHRQLGGFLVRNDRQPKLERISTGPLVEVVRVRAKYLQGERRPNSRPEVIYDWYYFRDRPLVYVTARVSQQEPFEWRELHFLELNFPGEDFKSWASGEPLQRGLFTGSQDGIRCSRWGALIDGANAIGMLRAGRLLFHDGRGHYGTYLHARSAQAWQPWKGTEREYSAWLWIGSRKNPEEAIREADRELPTDARVIVSVQSLHAQIEASRRRVSKKSQRPSGRPFELFDCWHVALASQLAAQGRFAEAAAILRGRMPESWTAVTAGQLNLLLEHTGDGMRVQSLFDSGRQRELAASEPEPLFSLTFRRPLPEARARDKTQPSPGRTGGSPPPGQTEQLHEIQLVADAGWQRVTVQRADRNGAVEIRWQRPRDARLAGVEVRARVVPDGKANAIRWSLEVRNPSSQWSLWQVDFPQLAVAELGEDGCVLFPRGPGEVQRGVWRRAFRYSGTYPSGWTSMQFFAAYDGRGESGVYFGSHDPVASTKQMLLASRPQDRSIVLAFQHPVPDMGRRANRFTLSGQAVWQLLRGDWFDAALIYRDWVRREARWYPELTADGRADTPSWMKELPVWVVGGGAPKACVPAVKQFARFMGVPVGFHWNNWHQIPFDNDYPHYFPTKAGFVEAVRELQAAGVFVMPYINGRLWDTRDRGLDDFEFTSVALPAATKNEKGEPYTETYGSKESDGSRVRLAAMCPSTRLWQDRIGSIVQRLFGRYGVKGVYIDQIAAAAPKLCFDPQHGHPLGGGHWWTAGYWQLLEKIRRRKPADRMLTTECNAEPYVRWMDGYLTWHWQHDGQVPAFPAVYGGAIQMFGRAYRGGETKDLALRMKAGQQLVFGEQIGWISPNVVREKQNVAFLKQVVGLRWRFRRYFYAGRMERPPRLTGEIPRVRADWQWSGTWWVSTDAVLTGAWRLPREGKLVLLFVNVSDRPVTATLCFDASAYGLSSEKLRAVRITARGSAGEPQFDQSAAESIPARFERSLSFPPRTAWAWEMSDR